MSEPQNKGQKQQDDKAKTQEQDLEQMLADAEKAAAEAEENATEEMSRDEELEQAKDQAVRAMAELQNAKRRMEEERQSFVKYASANLMKNLLPIVDNFERASTALPEELADNEWIKGMVHTAKTFEQALEKEGLEKIIPQAGDDFDTAVHEALLQDPNTEDGKIAQCLEPGYKLKDKVLRPAKVSVGNK